MTAQDFIEQETCKFKEGQAIIISGPDSVAVHALLSATRDNLINVRGLNCILPLDTRMVTQYLSDDEDRAVKFEYEALLNAADGSTPNVILIANEFDLDNTEMNHWQTGILDIDVVMDLLHTRNVQTINAIENRMFSFVREVFGYFRRVYYFDSVNDNVVFVKVQHQDRVPSANP
jgi:hypothetical protein